MTKQSSSDDNLRERLVAYLDGELSGDESEAIESQIGADDSVRNELRDLDRAWNALDALPMTHVEPSFTQSTVAMVATAAREEVVQQTAELPALRRRTRRDAWLLAGVAACCGFILAWALAGRRDRALLAELPIVQHASVLSQFQEVEFLKLLSNSPSIINELSQTEGVTGRAEEWAQLERMDLGGRRAWVEQLDDEPRRELSERSIAFQSMLPAQKERLRRANDELSRSAEPQRMRALAIAYHQVISPLPSGQRADLLEMEPEERLRSLRNIQRRPQVRLRDLVDENELAEFREALRRLSEEENFEAIVDRLLRRARGVDSDELQPFQRMALGKLLQQAKQLQQEPARLLVLAAMMSTRGQPRSLEGDTIKEIRERWPGWSNRVVESLPEGLRVWAAMPRDERQRSRMLIPILAETLRPIGPEDESRFFSEELSTEQVFELLDLPADQMEQRLREMMVEQEVGALGPAAWGQNDPRRRGQRGPQGMFPPDRGRGREGRSDRPPGPPPPRP